MQKMKCLIVEDEPLAAEVLQDYIRQVPFLRLKAICQDAVFALEVLRKEPFDLIFLDIHLPVLKGIDMLKSMPAPPKVIFTTAYQEYAVEGYALNVVDYLLKPIEFARFMMAVNKAYELQAAQPPSQRLLAHNDTPYLFFNVGRKKVKVMIDDILYIESVKEYVKIVCKDKSILTLLSLGTMEELLKHFPFLRIHRSYIVAKSKIDAFTSTDIEINGHQIPIGRSYREQVYHELEQ